MGRGRSGGAEVVAVAGRPSARARTAALQCLGGDVNSEFLEQGQPRQMVLGGVRSFSRVSEAWGWERHREGA